MNDLASIVRAVLPLIVLAALVAIVGAWDATFLSQRNLLTVASDTMTLFLMASGVTIVIIIGGIDLSVQAVASMVSCILAAYLSRWGAATLVAALAAGAFAGWTGGYASTRLRIPSFIATLAVSGVVTSAAYWFSATRAVNIPEDLTRTYLFWAVGTTFGVPREVWVGLVALAGLSFALDLTPFGRRVRAIGSQERAAIAAGLHVNRVKIGGSGPPSPPACTSTGSRSAPSRSRG
jgi:ribose transport system permease protein